MIVLLTSELIKKISLYKMSYFPDPYTNSKIKTEIELDFSNYATRSDLKNTAGAVT